jgi:hypothetical protein
MPAQDLVAKPRLEISRLANVCADRRIVKDDIEINLRGKGYEDAKWVDMTWGKDYGALVINVTNLK